MPVFWTIRAQRHLRQALAEELGREFAPARPVSSAGEVGGSCPGVLEGRMRHLNAMLAEAFGQATVVVKDQVIGYRRKKDRFTLMVDVFDPKTAAPLGSFVVKIGPEDEIREEVRGWDCCRPPGLRHDLVLLTLEPREPVDHEGRSWMCLVYGDAQQFLGVAETRPFEDVMLECVRDGVPKLLSIHVVIGELYDRIGHLLYGQAFIDNPAHADYVLDVPRLDDGLKAWEVDPACQAARRDASVVQGKVPYLDPVDYLRYVQKYSAHRDGRGNVVPRASPMPRSRAIYRPRSRSRGSSMSCRGCFAVALMATSTAGISWWGSSATRRCGRRCSTTKTWGRGT